MSVCLLSSIAFGKVVLFHLGVDKDELISVEEFLPLPLTPSLELVFERLNHAHTIKIGVVDIVHWTRPFTILWRLRQWQDVL